MLHNYGLALWKTSSQASINLNCYISSVKINFLWLPIVQELHARRAQDLHCYAWSTQEGIKSHCFIGKIWSIREFTFSYTQGWLVPKRNTTKREKNNYPTLWSSIFSLPNYRMTHIFIFSTHCYTIIQIFYVQVRMNHTF